MSGALGCDAMRRRMKSSLLALALFLHIQLSSLGGSPNPTALKDHSFLGELTE